MSGAPYCALDSSNNFVGGEDEERELEPTHEPATDINISHLKESREFQNDAFRPSSNARGSNATKKSQDGPPLQSECYFFASTTDVSSFVKWVDAVASSLKECPMAITSSGMQAQAIDSELMFYVSLELEAKGFSTYYFDHPYGTIQIGIAMQFFKNVLKNASTHDSLTMYIKKQDASCLGVSTFDGASNTSYNHDLTLLVMNHQFFGTPAVHADFRVRIDPKFLHHQVRYMSNIQSSLIDIGVENNALVLQVKGNLGTTKIHVHSSLNTDPYRQSRASEKGKETTTTEPADPLDSMVNDPQDPLPLHSEKGPSSPGQTSQPAVSTPSSAQTDVSHASTVSPDAKSFDVLPKEHPQAVVVKASKEEGVHEEVFEKEDVSVEVPTFVHGFDASSSLNAANENEKKPETDTTVDERIKPPPASKPKEPKKRPFQSRDDASSLDARGKRRKVTILSRQATLDNQTGKITHPDIPLTSYYIKFIDKACKGHVFGSLDIYMIASGLIIFTYYIGKIGVLRYVIAPIPTTTAPMPDLPCTRIADKLPENNLANDHSVDPTASSTDVDEEWQTRPVPLGDERESSNGLQGAERASPEKCFENDSSSNAGSSLEKSGPGDYDRDFVSNAATLKERKKIASHEKDDDIPSALTPCDGIDAPALGKLDAQVTDPDEPVAIEELVDCNDDDLDEVGSGSFLYNEDDVQDDTFCTWADEVEY